MAGHLALIRLKSRPALALIFCLLALAVHAAPPPPMAPAVPPATVPAPAVPPVPEDYFQRYGRILAPGTEPAHPLRLAMPFPDVGQIKIPGQAEIDMREKLEHLATMSDDDIRRDLEKWPAFDKMCLADEGAMLIRIQQFKDRRARIAQDRAHALGLLTLKPDQMERFEKEYWDKRLQMDRELARQFDPIFHARETQLEEQLFREFSTPGQPVPPPAPPKVAQDAKPAPPAASASQPGSMAR